MSVLTEVRTFLAGVGASRVDSCAYDTAWVATLRAPADPLTPQFPECLDWIRQHQHFDGSWGASWPYYHDRLISTLRAILTLREWNDDPADEERVRQGLSYIWRNAGRLAHDPWETVGFELLFPMLLDQAQAQNLPLPYSAFAGVLRMQTEKLARAPLHLAYDHTLPLATNLEVLGDGFDLRRAGHVQEPTGGVAESPSATAFLLQHLPSDPAATAYVQRAVHRSNSDGGAPTYWPLETWEKSWALHQFQHALPNLYKVMPEVTQPLLRFLDETRQTEGWTVTQHSSVKEADTTGVCFAVLGKAGYDPDPHLLYQYEEEHYFRCYLLERNPSISANAHVLDALHYCGRTERVARINKIMTFLRAVRQPGNFWFDKWHISPYYTTGNVVLAAYDFAPDLVSPSIDWLIHTPWPDGGWGHYHTSTLEETAYAMLALLIWRGAGHCVPPAVLERGAAYLQKNWSPTAVDYLPLWIGKALYTPVQVIQSAILAALLAWEVRS